MKKAAFFDIDGTILDGKNYIPASAVEGIHRMQAAGNYAFLCTGRSRAYVQHKELLAIGFDGIISGCGTMVEFHDRELYYKKLDHALVKKTVGLFKACHAPVIMEGRYSLFVDAADFGNDQYIKKLQGEIGGQLLPVTGSESEWEVSKFSCATDKADMARLKAGLKPDYDLLIHEMPVMEVVPKGCSKGTGILKVCERLGVAPEDTYAFGDSVNDLPMFAVAGCAIAMGNAAETVKKQASYVTDTLHDGGIYHALAHFELI